MSVGRLVLMKKAGTVLAGLRTKTIAWSGESIDLTGDDDEGYRKLDAVSAQEQIDLACDGVMKEETFREIALSTASKMLTDITFEFPILDTTNNNDAATISGNFRISSFEEGATYNDAVTFSMTLESSGQWTYTPESS